MILWELLLFWVDSHDLIFKLNILMMLLLLRTLVTVFPAFTMWPHARSHTKHHMHQVMMFCELRTVSVFQVRKLGLRQVK